METTYIKNKSDVRKFFYTMINKNDHYLVQKLIDTNLEFTINQRKFIGRNSFQELLKLYSSRYPKAHTEILSIIGEGDMVFAHWEIVINIPKDTIPEYSTGITSFKFRADKIIQIVQHWDTAGLDL